MPAYLVLVSHNGHRFGDILLTSTPEKSPYLREIEAVKEVGGTEYIGNRPVIDPPGGLDPDPGVADVRKPRRKTVKTEVADVEGGAVPDSGPQDGEG